MYSPTDVFSLIQQLQHQISWQWNAIRDLNERILSLEEEIIAMQNDKNMYIDKIEYKFDQLKVEQLEGTLNIGLSPQDREAIEQLAVNRDENGEWPEDVYSNHPGLFERIQQQIHHYLNGDVIHDVKKIEDLYEYPLDEPYRQFIINDLRRQVDKRIATYMNQLGVDLNPEEKEKKVIEKVRRDIYKAIETFVKNLPKQGGET